jgi:type VI secretion system protein ImpG
VKFSELRLQSLRFFLDAQPSTVHRLYELFLRNPQGMAVQAAPGRAPRWLGADSIRPVGFAPDEGLLDYPPESFLGYRIVQEYFAYPDKFMFVELSGLDAAAIAGETEKLDVSILLSEGIGELDLRVRPSDLVLGCTPAVNVFPLTVEPIRVTHASIEYPVVADNRNPRSYEIYALKSATSVERGSGRVTRYEPIYTLRHGATGSSGAYWHAVRRASLRKDDSGTDVYVSLVDEKFNPLTPASEVLTVEALCTNRDLPSRLAFGDPKGDFSVQGQPGVGRVVCVRNPSEPVRSPVGKGSRWRLISHLAVNHLSLSDESSSSSPAAGRDPSVAPALDALREILKLYDFVDSPVTRQRIAGLIGLRTRRSVRRIGKGVNAGFARGTEAELLFDPDMYAGSSVFLFASVLESFLGLYASLNSFTQVVARVRLREGVLKRWPPRAGELRLL